MDDYLVNRTWAEINLDNIAHNIKQIKKIVGKNVQICGAIKADAYGHGVIEVANTFAQNGVTMLAVSMLDEALQLRKSGIKTSILVLGYTDPKRAKEIILNNITQTVFSLDLAIALSVAATSMNKEAKIHIKIDTGMSRIGFLPGYDAIKSIVAISNLKGIVIEAIFTHFATADEENEEYTHKQFEQFIGIYKEAMRLGINIPIKHVCNSAATLQYPKMHLDMVRLGICLYGLYPSQYVSQKYSSLDLKPAMSFKSSVILIKKVQPNTFVGYNRLFKTDTESQLATIAVGYADGYPTLLKNKGKVLIKGEFLPVVGKVCMDQCMIDTTTCQQKINIGDEVVLFGKQGKNEIKVEDLATLTGLSHYELICIIGKRVPRIYMKDNYIQNVLNYLI